MADPVVVATSISGVEVYRAQALVRRSARVELPGGEPGGELRLGGLPFWLDDDSVRVRVVEGAGRVVDLHVELDVAARGGALRTTAEEALRVHARAKGALEVERARQAALVRFVEGIAPADPGGELPDELACRERHPAVAALELAAFAGPRALAARARIRAVERELRELEDRIAAARDALAREEEAERERLRTVRKAARIRVEAAAGAHLLELSYLVPAAAWVPEYDLRVADGRDEVELVVRAIVGQATGEPWPAVPLAFSTADLSRSSALPKLDSWRIGRAQPPRRSGWRELPDTVGELLADYERARPSLQAPELPELASMPRSARLDRIVAEEGEATRSSTQGSVRKKDGRAAPRPPSPAREEFTPMAGAALPPPPPPPMSAPAMMPAAAPVPAPARRMRSMPRMAGYDDDASAMLMESVSVDRRMAYEVDSEEDVMAAPCEPEAAGVAASRSALAYGRLRMQGPGSEAAPGQLKARTLLEELGERGLSLEDDLAAPSALSLDVPGGVPLQESAGHFAARFTAEAAIEVPSDGAGHQVLVARRSGPAERLLVCAPASGPDVYELVTLRNPLDVPLLAGPARIFRGGDFVAQTSLATHAPGRPLTVNLGVEPGVAVARNVAYEETSGGLLGGATVLTHRIELELRSRLPRPVRLRVLERVPVSDDPDVKVEVKRSTVKAEPYDQADRGQLVRGGLAMEVEFGARETRCCVFEYQVTIPSKKTLEGGNRRD
jgi:hypothetical protein